MENNPTGQTFEYMSSEWVTASSKVIQQLFAAQDLHGLSISFSEALTDSPAHLQRYGSSTIGWCIVIADGQVTVDDKPHDDATTRVVADYELFRKIQKFTFDDSPERIKQSQAMRQEAAAQGKFSFEGNLASVPSEIMRLISVAHDDIGRLTA
jgi:hypothetical protein